MKKKELKAYIEWALAYIEMAEGKEEKNFGHKTAVRLLMELFLEGGGKNERQSKDTTVI